MLVMITHKQLRQKTAKLFVVWTFMSLKVPQVVEKLLELAGTVFAELTHIRRRLHVQYHLVPLLGGRSLETLPRERAT